jgi:tetratricopeptide (TPR) repeat protein
MARKISVILSTLVIISLLTLFTGCHSIDSGRSQLVPKQIKKTPEIKAAEGNEADIVEELIHYRKAYRNALKSLVAHYKSTGNNMKLSWAKDELESTYTIPQYNYIIEAAVAGSDLRASANIADADLMYQQARSTHRQAEQLLVVKNEDLLRVALNEYNKLISKHPASDKIDDAAYYSGQIIEYFKDYSIALIYYQRAYQWDENTPYPARYKAAYILDNIMGERGKALELYRKAVESENLATNYKEYAQQRINQLSKENEE